MPARTSIERRQGMRAGPWEWVIRWIRGASIDWKLEVGGQLEEFGGGIVGRIEIGWISEHGRERVFEVVVREEVVRAGWRVVVRIRGWGVVIKGSVQGT
jgi:hypothetical protein